MKELLFDSDITLDAIKLMRVVVVGYGNQGRAQALNLRDSGINVVVALRENSESIKKAQSDGFECVDISQGVRECDIISILVPDQVMSDVFEDSINRYLKPGKTLLFSHGYNIHYKEIVPPQYVDVVMVAPSGPGYAVRQEYKNSRGIPTLVAVNQDVTGKAKETALAYSKAIGGTRACAFTSTFKEETETDLFGEQMILTGIIPRIINESLKVLLEAGYSPAVAWFVSFYEVRQISELISSVGLEDFYKAVSDTAEYGGLTRSDSLIDGEFKAKMKSALKSIQSGEFHREWKEETKNGYKHLKNLREKQQESPINDLTKKMLEALKNQANEE